MRRLRFAFLLAGLVVAGPGLAQAQDGSQVEDGAGYAVRVELHPFQSLTLTDAQFLTGASDGAKPVTIAGSLRIARSGTDRLPVVVLTHGSGGIGSNVEFWQRRLNGLGVATFAIDGFTGRGLTSVNTNQSLLGRTNLILDIYRALDVLAKHPRVDPQRVAVMGFSRGGQAALYASLRRFDALWNRSGIVPALFLPVYPDCSIAFRSDTEVQDRPIRILAGQSDDYNPAAACGGYVERLKAAGRNVSLTVYPDAHHVFDGPIGPNTPTTAAGAQTVRGCAIREDDGGRLTNASTGAAFTYADPCVERDPHVGSNAAARTAALEAVTRELRAAFHLD